MNIELKSKKLAVMLFYAAIVLTFFGCQTSINMEEAMNQTALYDYQARHYNPELARFIMTEPQAEKYASISPYAYVLDKPIYIDSKGDSLAKVFLVSADSVIWKKAK